MTPRQSFRIGQLIKEGCPVNDMLSAYTPAKLLVHTCIRHLRIGYFSHKSPNDP